MSSIRNVISQLPLISHLFTSQLPSQSTISTTQHCPNPSLSCPINPPKVIDTCCINHPSGHFLQTQFWDSSPATGSNVSWTIHGLWPDLCTGGFDQFCDTTRSEYHIRAILQTLNGGNAALLDFMDANWLTLDGNPEQLWAHEWNKHGTCISTIEPTCYQRDDEQDGAATSGSSTSKSTLHADLLDYFVQTTSLFRTLDTFAIFAESGIVPSYDRHYDLTELQDAIEASPHGFPVTFRCRNGELNEIWYHFSVRGSLRHAIPGSTMGSSTSEVSPFLNFSTVRDHFIPAIPDGAKSDCPIRGIKYLPKVPAGHKPPPVRPTHTATTRTSNPSATSTPFSGKGHLAVHVVPSSASESSAETTGCLIRHGEWYTSGTCATYLAQSDVVDPGHAPLFSLSSSFSPCLVNPRTAKFECTKASSAQGIFSSASNHTTVLTYKDSDRFYAEKIPGKFGKVDIYADDGGGKRPVELRIHWVPV
ncbi:hypothetical protein PV10_00166 [Exophiala mesophila]|uniref:Ribonuclease T2-like n=1 Tax=Exophiala mesophila TaxID=212818 RepID=A0A0D2ABH6_EXOME|nr:uncharacterized protein PV10_00166 [Exophiala mesophila]KIV96283.1 hypothetical protein PV10_00166 [Exophiala mesophila]